MKRIFIELDEKAEGIPGYIQKPYTVLSDCGADITKTWSLIVSSDEIYFQSILARNGRTKIESPDLFNLIMERAIKDGIINKQVFICSDLDEIRWSNIDLNNLKACFSAKNKLFVRESNKWIGLKEFIWQLL